ncbi:DUF3043 domain-containing protein [Kineococcus aurantiacus]|uniref:DUF3043 domain-containing protein n=1 Tax=Kineococcus aurantiacus TaxID=37633 RepID=A0A7Y9ASA4_9ACTN|nr:hypothetical protein [Kineococcus aurantiacus]
MFGRSKEKSAPAAQESPAVELTKVGGKGRPTPRRSEAQARNARPLVPADRKAAQKLSREAQRAERAKMQAALLTGDERYLPVRDRGAQKRFVRDVVDARRNVGEYFLIIAGVSLVLSMVASPLKSQVLLLGTTLLIYAMLAVVVVDSVLLGRRIRRAVAAKFPEPERGLVSYGITRALQIRRMRRPVPMVARGAHPS